jgi:import inner membrane translocase subunit TIM21
MYAVNIPTMIYGMLIQGHEQVQGPKGKGMVNMHLIRRAGHHDFDYKYFYVDMAGHPRIYLENADASPDSKGKQGYKLFGVKWA